MLHTATDLPPKKSIDRRLSIETVLQILALLIVTSIFLKAIIDIDINYDPWWYHIPFAARIWGIVPKELFIGDEKWFEPRYQGFPLLAHFLQGFLWRITDRVQSTNLVGFLSLIFYLVFLKSYFRVPLYLSAIALLTIPLVLAHSTSSYVDLFGNIGASVLVMMTYNLYRRSQLPSKGELFILVLGAAIAANTKTQLQILVFFICGFVVIRLGWLYFRHSSFNFKRSLKIVSICILAAVLIFATPVKNTVVYGNPLYPVKVEIAGTVLNHKLVPEAYQDGNRPVKWLRSILEIDKARWTVDQWSDDPEKLRMGGFFGAYVVFNLLLLVGLSIAELWRNRISKAETSRDASTALLTVLVMSIVPANFPQSHELRYFIFWMISLVSLNLYLISTPRTALPRWRWLQPKYMGLVCLVFLTIVLSNMGKVYAKPSFYNLETQIAMGVKPELLSQIEPETRNCLISRHRSDPLKAPMAALKWAFLYSSPFHPEIDYPYAIQTAFNPESCGELKQIPQNVKLNY
ncbi:hypothetical protein [Myxosarcina sp. GI1]|uniref:hypothetical protein n=1 Tax=Myxosarcina sp. GI1 TaxID=1541065 RepID=UPI00068C1463|nr:hypothetical protein [Myxosarcina sp. GI1]